VTLPAGEAYGHWRWRPSRRGDAAAVVPTGAAPLAVLSFDGGRIYGLAWPATAWAPSMARNWVVASSR
jgi:hypothetical protein